MEPPTKRIGFTVKVPGSSVFLKLNIATQVKNYRLDCPFTYAIDTKS